jgi:hypothetical protein
LNKNYNIHHQKKKKKLLFFNPCNGVLCSKTWNPKFKAPRFQKFAARLFEDNGGVSWVGVDEVFNQSWLKIM